MAKSWWIAVAPFVTPVTLVKTGNTIRFLVSNGWIVVEAVNHVTSIPMANSIQTLVKSALTVDVKVALLVPNSAETGC